MSYQRAGQRIEQLELEVQQLLAKAEQADATPLQDGLTIPEEITRQQERQAALARARAEIEACVQARYAAQLAQHQAKLAERAAKKERGEKVSGQPPPPPTPTPAPGEQYNFIDPESRIMKVGPGNHFQQSYNAQAVVEVESRLIVGQRVSPAPNDQQELGPTLAAFPRRPGRWRWCWWTVASSASRRCDRSNTPRPAKPPARRCMRLWRKPGITGAWRIWKRGPNRRRLRPGQA